MAEGARGPRLYTIPFTRAFGDSLAAGLIARHGDGATGLARGLVLLPNNRAKRALTEAFVRASGGGLLLPRLVAIGDPALDEDMGALLDAGEEAPVPPAVSPMQRRMILARLVGQERARAGAPVDADEAVRLAGELARTLDQLLAEEVSPSALADLPVAEELSEHWRTNLALFRLLLDRWPGELARIGRIDAARRRALLLDRLTERWRRNPPGGFVCVAGITDAAPAVARLLRCIGELPEGQVVLAGLDIALTDQEWETIGPHAPDPVTGIVARPVETHPQFQLKRLLHRMGVNRREFTEWPHHAGPASDAARARAIATALAPARLTAEWSELPPAARRLTGVRAAELATPAEEAQTIALALRGALEPEETSDQPRTAALVTPDRALARRVAAHCARWGIAIDDTAGRPLSILPPGTLLLAIAEAAAQDFAPIPLLTLLKHPLVMAGERRLAWLEGVRALDRALRGPRPAAGLTGIDAHLADPEGRNAGVRRRAAEWWPDARALLAPLAAGLIDDAAPFAARLACLRDAASALAGDAAWSGPAGRAAAELLDALEQQAGDGPALIEPEALAPMLRTLMNEVAVRPPQGGHPRLAIYGLIEARLQTADLMILGGLNEGVWPGIAAPDPWLAPRIRSELGLPGLETRIGVAAHDFAQGLGAPAVLLTRSRRDASAPALPSRFWLRLSAMAGAGFERDAALERWARALDDPGVPEPAQRPAPSPAREQRPTVISVTEVDRLKADPYAFYARRVLRLAPLEAVDADPTAAWRGTVVHAVLERWAREDDCAPDALRPRAEAMMADAHPLLRALWWPRLEEAIDWIAATMTEHRATGREVLAVEGSGKIDLAGVTLNGRFDRIDRDANGSLIVVDYKTGKPPSIAAVREGFSLQLGLLGWIAEAGGFAGVSGEARGFEYWSLAKRGSQFGYVDSPVDPKRRDPIPADEFVARGVRAFEVAAARWLTGDEPFTAKLVPEYAPYADYDQLMRRDEWWGRE